MGEQCPAESVEGVDVFDGQGPIDWPAFSAAGIAFAIIKATQGTYDTQATFAFNWSHAKSAGLLRSAYHFFDPTEDGVAQAQHFLSVVGVPSAGDLPAMLDIECPDGDPNCLYVGASGDAPPGEIASRMWDFLRTVEAATGKKPIVYTFTSYLAETGIESPGLSAYPLALAYPSDGACVSPPLPWATATFWQYSWDGSVAGIPAPVDRDRFLGSWPALQALAAVPSSIPAPVAVMLDASVMPTPAPTPTPTPAPADASPADASPATPEPIASTTAASCALAPLPLVHGPLIAALACALLAGKRRRVVAPPASRVLAGRTAPPCRRPTSEKA